MKEKPLKIQTGDVVNGVSSCLRCGTPLAFDLKHEVEEDLRTEPTRHIVGLVHDRERCAAAEQIHVDRLAKKVDRERELVVAMGPLVSEYIRSLEEFFYAYKVMRGMAKP